VSVRFPVRLSVVAHCTLLGGCALSYGTMAPSGVDANCSGFVSHDLEDGPYDSKVGLQWLRPDAPRDRQLGSAWCETVGAPVYVASPADRFETGPRDSLLVVSWNMNVGGGDLRALMASELGVSCPGGSRSEGIHTRPFVILVQEAYRRDVELPAASPGRLIPPTIDPEGSGPEESDIVELADLCGLSLAYVPSMRNGPDSGTRPHEDKGNAILSNLPLAAPFAIDLPFETYRRVAVGAELTLGGRSLRVVSVHLDVAGLPYRVLVTGNQSRARQVAGLVEALDSLDAVRVTDAGTVVGGDLNAWTSKETAVRLMRRAFSESPPYDGVATRGIFPTDHVFFRTQTDQLQASTYRAMEGSYGSDHRGRLLLLTPEGADRPVE